MKHRVRFASIEDAQYWAMDIICSPSMDAVAHALDVMGWATGSFHQIRKEITTASLRRLRIDRPLSNKILVKEIMTLCMFLQLCCTRGALFSSKPNAST
jgi:hypothetical protein